MKINFCVIICLLTLVEAYSQKSKLRADEYYFQYNYASAVVAYEEYIYKGNELSLKQQLNLSDSYFKTKKYKEAATSYLAIFKQDSLINNNHLNMLLESLDLLKENEKIDSIISVKSINVNNEFYENINFNRNLLQGGPKARLDYNIFNLNSNSIQSDFSPTFYGEKVLFTSGRPKKGKKKYLPSGESYLDIYVARRDNTGQISVPNIFNGIPESNFHKATPYFSAELNGVFYILSNTENGQLAFDKNGKNSLAIGLKKEKNDFVFLLKDLGTSFYYPFYNPENQKLYFSANFDDGYGGTDIYYVYTNNGQIMSAPINLGPRINSPGNEIAPFIFENSLYFSSDVFYGLGGMDVYRSNMESESSFSIPVNLGPGINSIKDDFGFIIKNEGEGLLGYFASNRTGGKGADDIYGFLVKEKPGLKTLTISGQVVTPLTGKTLTDVNIQLLDNEGNLLKESLVSSNGVYRIEVPWQDEVVLKARKERHAEFYKKINGNVNGVQVNSLDIEINLPSYDDLVEDKEGQKVIKLDKFFFDRGKSNIIPSIASELDKVVQVISYFPELQLRIETHTDSRGGSSTNFRITQQRSDAIKKYLTSNGVPVSNILYSVGYGEDRILNNCKNGVYCLDFLHKQNQRSLIVVLNDNLLFD